MSLLSEVPFAAALVYSPRGSSDESKKSREQLRDPVKRADESFLREVRDVLRNYLPPEIVRDFLAPDVVLVPTPRSAPLTKDALWPARLLCDALVAGGMGKSVLPCLERTEPVQKSAYAGLGERPTSRRHFETMRIRPNLLLRLASRITVVDDVVTKGATLIAAASRVKEAFPRAEVRTFALVRTMGRVPEIEQMGEPCTGTIKTDGHSVQREP